MPIEPEALAPEILAEPEPRYLRRQKPVEIRRRRFGRRSLQSLRRWFVITVSTLVGGAALYATLHFFLFSPRVLLLTPDQVVITGNHYVTRRAIVEKFRPDRGHSVLLVPLDARRKAIEEMPWVEQASVERVLPNRIRVDLTERAPIAFLRLGPELALVDGTGVILERPPDAEYHFPVVTGITEAMPREQREQRMRLYAQFMKEIDAARPAAPDFISEVDLSDEKDVRAIVDGLSTVTSGAVRDQDTVLVHFGEGDFASKFRLLTENLGQWRASAGCVDSVDLRFARQVVVNPEVSATACKAAGPEGDAKR